MLEQAAGGLAFAVHEQRESTRLNRQCMIAAE